MVQKVLLAGTSFSALPILRAIQKTGAEVTVCGNLPDDVCVGRADNYADVNYAVADELLDLYRRGQFDAIVPSCNDEGYLACSLVAEQEGLPGYDPIQVSELLHSKHKFRTALTRLGLRSPKVYAQGEADSLILSDVRYPLIVKPVDSSGGKGMSRVETRAELERAIDVSKSQSQTGTIILEEYVEGSLHSHSAFIQHGEILEDYFADEFCTTYSFAVNCSNHPSFLPESIRQDLRRCIRCLIDDLQLTHGLLHTQFLRSGENAVIVESMRRCPGDLFGDMIEMSTDAHYYTNYVAPFLGKRLHRSAVKTHARPIARHTISRNERIDFFDINIDVPALRTRIVPLHPCGAHIAPAPRDKCALVFLELANVRELEHFVDDLARRVRV